MQGLSIANLLGPERFERSSLADIPYNVKPQKHMTKIFPKLFGFTLLVATAQAQTLYLSESNQISAFDATTGAIINWPLITQVSYPGPVAIAGTNMFVPCFYSPEGFIGLFTTSGAMINTSIFTVPGYSYVAVSSSNVFIITSETTVGTYTTSGVKVNASFVNVAGLPVYAIFALAVSGNQLFLGVLNYDYDNEIYEYDATTGELITTLFFQTGSPSPPLATSGNTLYAMSDANKIGSYDATTGATINSSLITNLNSVGSIAVYGNDLYVLDNAVLINGTYYNDAHIGKYNATSGSVINADLVDMGMGMQPFGTHAAAITVGPPILPVSPMITNPAFAGGLFSFVWNAISNADYQVQYSTNIQEADWMNLGGIITATHITMTSGYPTTNNQGYYRVLNQPNGR
jgi:hypothetical protein